MGEHLNLLVPSTSYTTFVNKPLSFHIPMKLVNGDRLASIKMKVSVE